MSRIVAGVVDVIRGNREIKKHVYHDDHEPR